MSRKTKTKSFNLNSTDMKSSEDIQENNCVVCFKGVDTYSIGQCDHPVCFECSTRMRVLCKQNECPICRQEMPLVYFTKNIRPFKQLVSSNILSDKKYKIEFENEAVRNAYIKLLEHSCPRCTDKVFNAFHQLQDHVRRVHQLNYCDLCVENLKIFTFERRVYTRHELVSHRRAGDADDKSHKGHPICEFCDIRYMDSDELFRHLRRDHLYCHFCDADGYHQYYHSYAGLRDHFSQEHYLCEEGECTDEQFTSVFRTEIDLKAHKTTAHGRMMGKVGLKQARTLELEFTLAPRQRRSRNHHNREEEETGLMTLEDMEPVYHQAGLNTDCIEEFPCLGGSSGQPQTSSGAPATGRLMIGGQKLPFRNRNNFSVNDENFPVLGNPVPPSPTVNVTVSNMLQPQRSGKTTAGVSIQVKSAKQPQMRKEDFPALSQSSHFPALSQQSNFPSLSSNASTSTILNPQWSEPKPKPKPVSQPQPKPPPKPTFNMDTSQFPSLGTGEPPSTSSKKTKNKKNKPNQPQQQQPQLVQQPVKPEPSEPKPAKSEKTKKKQKEPDKSEVKSDNKTKSNNNKTDNNKQKNNKKQDNNKTEVKQLKNKKEEKNDVKINTNGETNNNIVENGDCVSLITEKMIKLVPPGFGPAPPPGFGRLKPPPGLPPPGFSHHSYLMPRNFAVRNKKLITEVVNSVGEEYYEQFKKFSAMFRNGVISAEDYVEHCSDMMGHVAFDSLFPELLALLPDISKQQELWGAMDSNTKRSLDICEACRQVLTNGDMSDHIEQHAANLDNQNFPPLPSLLPLS